MRRQCAHTHIRKTGGKTEGYSTVVQLVQWVKAQDCLSRDRRFNSGKNTKKSRTQIYILAHQASSKATTLFLTKLQQPSH